MTQKNLLKKFFLKKKKNLYNIQQDKKELTYYT